MNLILTILLVLSFAGFYLAYKTFISDNSAFFPLLFVAESSVVAYVFGIAGVLRIGFYIVLGIGILLIPLSVAKILKTGKKDIIKLLLDPALLFLLVGTIWAYFITRNVGLSHPDDFSHWYKICKVLHADNSFPTNIDIRFTTYTPGTATWIYIFTNAAGFSVPNCLWAQSLINLAACCSLISVIPSNASKLMKSVMFIGISATAVLLCSIDVSTYSLLVDCTLPLIALCAAFYLYEHKFMLDKISIPVLVILIGFMEVVKFSGLIFALFILIFYLMESKKQAQTKKAIRVLVTFILPVVFSILYRVRNSFIYSNINVSNQAVSIERFSQLLSAKSSESVIKTVLNVFAMAFNPAGQYAQVTITWVCLLLMVILALLQKKKMIRTAEGVDFLKLLEFSFLCYLIYVVFLAFTYVFSMNAYEAETLSCCFRYMGSVAVFITGLFCYHLMKSFALPEDKKLPVKMAVYSVITAVFGHLLFGYNYIWEGKQQYSPHEYFIDSTPWNKISEYAEEKMEFTDAKYLVIWDESYLANSHYISFQIDYVAGAYLRSVKITSIMMSEMDDKADLISEYDSEHIIVVGELNN